MHKLAAKLDVQGIQAIRAIQAQSDDISVALFEHELVCGVLLRGCRHGGDSLVLQIFQQRSELLEITRLHAAIGGAIRTAGRRQHENIARRRVFLSVNPACMPGR